MNPKCNVCNKKFKHYGAILFSPPFYVGNKKFNLMDSHKFHICKKCYFKIIYNFGGLTQAEERFEEERRWKNFIVKSNKKQSVKGIK